ncbi:N-acetylglucosamine-6-phosphate deacetylase [Jiangella gansuensis]|uniref:N-acetylglucosamine-6-phosphate deacetylase n=1 Tax=Jiangella gansuensis TaxID=281473 RepID=UPI0004B7C7A6|nr:amidohydrolase family protein [Jiangella gansuensis]
MTAKAERWALVNGEFLLPDGIRRDVAVMIEGETVGAVVDAADRATLGGVPILDLGGRLATPGLIDLHVHGGFGYAFDRIDELGTEPSVPAVLRRLARSGVTSAQVSLVSAPVPQLCARLAQLAVQDTARVDGAQFLGVHLEGPFLAVAQCGAHDPAALCDPAPADVTALLRHRDLIRMVTLAPELPGAIDAVTRFASAGIVVAAGHSAAVVDDLMAAQAAGLRHVTHLWSGQSTTQRHGAWRVPGLLEAALASTGLTAEVIADGRHLPPHLLEIARRCLGERLVVVSDGTPGTGMPRGYTYQLGAVQCEVGDGVGMVVGADAFGGSTATLPRMLRHLHDELGWPVAEAVATVTSRPAAVAGLGDRKGAVAAGMDADLAVFGEGFRPWGTVLRGRWLAADDMDDHLDHPSGRTTA